MNRLALWVLGATCLLMGASCSQAGPGGTGNGNGSTGGSTASQGGSVGQSGSPQTGSTGGNSTSGGSTASGGATASTGGASATAGSAGANTTSSGGASSAGAGGVSAAGGSSAGGSPAVGGGSAAGAGGSAGGGVTAQTIVPTLNDLLWVGTCTAGATGTESTKDCSIRSILPAGGCNNTTSDFWSEGAFQVQKHTVGGTSGAKYTLNLDIRGVTGGKTYNNGTPQSKATVLSQTSNDGWYVGGIPTVSKWNTYEIHVSPPVPGQPVNNQALTCTGCPTPPDNVYYTNSIPSTDGVHETFPIKINASFPVLGGGTITLIIHDSNCAGQQNCGSSTDANAMCTDPRKIDVSGLIPAPTFNQPYTQTTGGSTFHPQWLYIDVTSVTAQ